MARSDRRSALSPAWKYKAVAHTAIAVLALQIYL